MKKLIPILILIVANYYSIAQSINKNAYTEYKQAEKAYQEKDIETCIIHLNEAERLSKITEGKINELRGQVNGSIKEKIYLKVQEMPTFRGGEEALNKYISRKLTYPNEERDSNKSGKVQILFTIEKDGKLTDIKVLRGLGYYFDKEALKLVENMPKWNPGIHFQKPVRVQYILPVEFSCDLLKK